MKINKVKFNRVNQTIIYKIRRKNTESGTATFFSFKRDMNQFTNT